MTALITLIVRDAAGLLWAVREPTDAALDHCYEGHRVKRVRLGYAPLKAQRQRCVLVRKAGTTVLDTLTAEV